MELHNLADPFSHATVVIADDYVNTFPHPQGLMTYLQRLFVQLGVEILSLERPITVKGSWTTVIKIDAFLKTLIATLQKAISKGAVPNEDFSAAFAQFEDEVSKGVDIQVDLDVDLVADENNAQTALETTTSRSSTNSRPQCQNERCAFIQRSSESKTQSGVNVSEVVENRYCVEHCEEVTDVQSYVLSDKERDITPHDKWYFNSNPRGRTCISLTKKDPCSGKAPPEPLIIFEKPSMLDENKSNVTVQPAVSEIEKALLQVYKKETIQKFHKKSPDNHKEQKATSEPEVVRKFIKDADFEPETDVGFPDNDNHEIDFSETQTQQNFNLSLKEKRLVIQVPKLDSFRTSSKEKNVKNENLLYSDANSEIEGHPHHQIAMNKECVAHRRKSKRQSTNIKKVLTLAADEDLPNDQNQQKEPEKLVKCKRKESTNVKRLSRSRKAKKGSDTKLKNGNDAIRVSTNKQQKSAQGKKAEARLLSQRKKKEDSRKSHHKLEDPNAHYGCDECPYETNKHMHLTEHKRRVHLTKSFKCEECAKEFGFQKDLRRHMSCHKKAENCCDICGKMYKEARKLVEHKKIHDAGYVKPEFPCKFCAKSFSTKYVLAYHIKADHLGMKRSYICPTCGSAFSQKNSYLQHANVHLGIRPFSCEVCGKSFSYEKSLKEHKFMHKEDKVFNCNVCNKAFRQASGLAIHMKIHKETKDYVCSMCGRGFNQKQALVRHERIHAGEKPYECNLCKRSFSDPSVLRRHMILIHKTDPKKWRVDTICHVPKRTDFFISVLDKDGSNSSVVTEGSPHHQTSHSPLTSAPGLGPEETIENLKLTPSTAVGQSVEMNYVVQFQVTPDNHSSNIKDEQMKYSEYENSMLSGSKAMTSTNSTSIQDGQNTLVEQKNLEKSQETTHQPHGLEAIADNQETTMAVTLPSQHVSLTSENTSAVASVLPLTYQPIGYTINDPQNIHQLQYAAMLSGSQPYAQAIVMLPDSLGNLAAYHQPEMNFSIANCNDSLQAVQLTHMSENSEGLTSPTISHMTEVSRVISPPMSSSMYCQVETSDQQQPQQ